MKKWKMRAYFWLFAAVVVLGIGLWLSWQSYSFLKTAKSTQGVIVTADFTRNGRSGYWNLLTRFTTEQGRPVTAMIWTQKANVIMSDWQPGQGFPVLYDPANPQEARAAGFKDFWMYPMLLLAFSLFAFFTAWRTFQGEAHKDPRHEGGSLDSTELGKGWDIVRQQMRAGVRSYWNILNPILGIGFILFMSLWVLPFGYRWIPRLLCPGAFLFIFPGEGLAAFVWPPFYFIFGFLAVFPFLFMAINLVEFCIPWARRAFENVDAKHNPRWSFWGATRDLWGLGKWALLLLIPAFFGIMRFYYLDVSGAHLFHFPLKTVDYTWDDVSSVQFSAKGRDEIKDGGPLVYHLLLKNGEDLEVSWDYGQDPTDLQLAEGYWTLSRHLDAVPSVRVHSSVTEKGAALLRQLLGNQVKGLLLERK